MLKFTDKFQIILQNIIPSFLICTLSFSLYLCNLKSMISGEHEPFRAGATHVRDDYHSGDVWCWYFWVCRAWKLCQVRLTLHLICFTLLLLLSGFYLKPQRVSLLWLRSVTAVVVQVWIKPLSPSSVLLLLSPQKMGY